MKKKRKRVIKSKDDYVEIDTKQVLSILKNNWNWILLILIIIFAFNIRMYHADYPVVGYHAWKETHYLTEARNFAEDGFFTHGFFVPEADFTGTNRDPTGAHSDTFPVTSIILSIIFKITGPSLLAARLFGIIFNVGTVVMLYLFMRKLFKREDLAFLVAILAAINPLFIFFGRNVQLMSPGVFFMVTSAYYFLKFRETESGKHMILTALFLVLAALTKYPFFFIVIPMLITFPWKKFLKNYKKYYKPIAISALFVLFLIFWFIYSNYYIASQAGNQAVSTGAIDLSLAFKSSFWKGAQKNYIADNFTTVGFIFALLGMALTLVLYKKKTFGHKWLLANIAMFVVFMLIMANKLKGHNYHWFPMAPFIIMMVAYFIFFIAHNLGKLASSSNVWKNS